MLLIGKLPKALPSSWQLRELLARPHIIFSWLIPSALLWQMKVINQIHLYYSPWKLTTRKNDKKKSKSEFLASSFPLISARFLYLLKVAKEHGEWNNGKLSCWNLLKRFFIQFWKVGDNGRKKIIVKQDFSWMWENVCDSAFNFLESTEQTSARQHFDMTFVTRSRTVVFTSHRRLFILL